MYRLILTLVFGLLSACAKNSTDPNAGINGNQYPTCQSIDGEIRFSASNVVLTDHSLYGGVIPNQNNYGYGSIVMSTSQSLNSPFRLTNSNNLSGALILDVSMGAGGGTYNNYTGQAVYHYVNLNGSLTLNASSTSQIRSYLQNTQYGNSNNNYNNNGNYNGNSGNGYNNGYGYNNAGLNQSACVSGMAINIGVMKNVNTGQPQELRTGQLLLYLNSTQTLYYTIPF